MALLLASLTIVACAAEEGSSPESASSDLAASPLALGHYMLRGAPSEGSYAELVLKTNHRFEARAYSYTFWERSVADEEARTMSGKFTLEGNVLTLLTEMGNPYGVYAVSQSAEAFAFDVTSDPHHQRKFEMTFQDSGTTLNPEPPPTDPGAPPDVEGGTQLRCRSGRHGVNISISKKTGEGWLYQLVDGRPDHVALSLDTAHAPGGGWLDLVGSSELADEDYELSLPDGVFRKGAKGVDVNLNAGSALGGVFTAGGLSCDRL